MKILLIQTAFLGDVVLTTPLLRSIREEFPEAQIDVLLKKGTESILTNNPRISKVIAIAKNDLGFLAFLKFALEIRKERYDLVFCPHFSHRSSLLAWATGAPKRIGYKESGFSFLHTIRIPRPRVGPHETTKLFSLLGQKNYNARPELFPPENRLLHWQSQIETYSPYLVVAPSSLWETKRMPWEKFVEVLQILQKESTIGFVFIGSSEDQNLTAKIIGHLDSKRILDLSGKTTLVDLMCWIKGAKALFSNDSSPIHFGSAFDIPTLMVYGATIKDFGYHSLSTQVRYAEVSGLSCRPCGIHGGHKCPEGHFKCMKDQSVGKIVQSIKELIL